MEGSPMQITRVLFIALAAIGVSADRTWSQPSTADYPKIITCVFSPTCSMALTVAPGPV